MPLAEAINRIAAAGAGAYEFWAWGDNELDSVYAAQSETGLRCAAMCGSFEPLNVPERHEEYMRSTENIIKIAKKLGARILITQVGREIAGTDRRAQHDAIVSGLRKCAPMMEDSGIILAVEPLNALRDHPGYYLISSAEGFDIVRETGSANVKLLFDIYHQQVTEGNVLENMLPNLDLIAHIHTAGNPGRHEMYENSELDYAYVVERLKSAGYKGGVGLEYLPLRNPDESLRLLFEKMPKL